MKSTILGLVAAVLFTSSAFAKDDYKCYGKESGGHGATLETYLTINSKSVTFEDPDGTEMTLSRVEMKNESKNTYATYGDYEYDGYGGSIELRVPKKIRAGDFPIYYAQDVYSEIGRVGQIRIKAICKSN